MIVRSKDDLTIIGVVDLEWFYAGLSGLWIQMYSFPLHGLTVGSSATSWRSRSILVLRPRRRSTLDIAI
jgi:hypothetical protein